MTTLLVSKVEGAMAADRRATMGDQLATGEPKIIRLKNRFRTKEILVGVSGPIDTGYRFVEWLKKAFWKGAWGTSKLTEKELENSGFLVLDEDLNIYHFACADVPLMIKDQYAGDGTGYKYGLGALAHGASLENAIRIACQFDHNSGNGQQIEYIGTPTNYKGTDTRYAI